MMDADYNIPADFDVRAFLTDLFTKCVHGNPKEECTDELCSLIADRCGICGMTISPEARLHCSRCAN